MGGTLRKINNCIDVGLKTLSYQKSRLFYLLIFKEVISLLVSFRVISIKNGD